MQMRGEVIRANINAWRGSLEMSLEGVFGVHVDAINPVEYALHPGVGRRALLKSDSATGPRILLVEFDPGRGFLELDVHQPGPEYIYVLQGIFHDGAREYPAGSFIHNPTGSSHIPQSATGCKLLVILPAG
jgi:anti-sigma factor ChrR (cupin superfamily)